LLIASAEEVQMIGHDDELADHPAVPLGSRFEFGPQNGEDWVIRQQSTTARHANRQKIDG
jgi:hypothetical protein